MKELKYILLTLVCTLFASCMGERYADPEEGEIPYGNLDINAINVITIEQLKQKYATVIANSGMTEITEDVQLLGRVTGNDIGGNIYKQICVQDATGAMIVGINGTGLFPFLSVGQQILINLKDLCIGGYGQQTQLGDEYNGSIGRMSTSKWEDHVRILPSHDMSQIDTIDFYTGAKSDMARYCGHLVCLKDVQIGDADGTTTLAPEYTSGTTLTYNGSTNGYVHHTLNGESMNTLLLRTSTYADFAALVIPQKPVTLYGIATRYRNTWQILIRAEEDIKIDK